MSKSEHETWWTDLLTCMGEDQARGNRTEGNEAAPESKDYREAYYTREA